MTNVLYSAWRSIWMNSGAHKLSLLILSSRLATCRYWKTAADTVLIQYRCRYWKTVLKVCWKRKAHGNYNEFSDRTHNKDDDTTRKRNHITWISVPSDLCYEHKHRNNNESKGTLSSVKTTTNHNMVVEKIRSHIQSKKRSKSKTMEKVEMWNFSPIQQQDTSTNIDHRRK